MRGPCELRFIADLSVIRTRGSGHHHGIKHLLVLAHHADSRHLHAHVVQGFGVLEANTVFLGEGRTYRDTQNLCLHRARSSDGTQVIPMP